MKNSSITNANKRLLSNTMFLYIMTFSTQFFSFLVVPYLTRVLGPIVYGKVGIAQAYMTYIQIILDFGFMLFATQKVVEYRNDAARMGSLVSAVTVSKLGLSVVVSILFSALVISNSDMRHDYRLYILFMVATITNAMMPDYYYRGIEQMKMITIRTFCVKGLCTCLTFVFIHKESDYWMIPLFQLLGNAFSVVLMYRDMRINHGVGFRKTTFQFIKYILCNTFPFFVSRAASTVYQGLNTIILGATYGAAPVVGYYTSADKIISLGKSASGPIADSLYPYMIKEKNYKLIKKVFMIFMPIIVLGTAVMFIFAEPICVLLFGAEYAQAGNVLRCLLPILLVIFPTYILCFPVMVPMGLSKWANFSNIIGLCTQSVGLIILFAFSKLNIYTICLLTSVSEVSVFFFRLFAVLTHLKKNK